MKRILSVTALLFSAFIGFSQPCTPNAPTGNSGVFPPPDSIPCIERHVPYDFTMQLENFDTFVTPAGNITVDFTRIDSVVNFPCGITWVSDSLQFAGGETGCIRVSGTSKEIVGQYPLKIYLTMQLSNVPLVGTYTASGELNDLISQFENLAGPQNYDYRYVSRVINSGDPCPARDTSSDLVSAGNACPPFGVDISGITVFCTGSSTLTATPKYEFGAVTYSWSPGGETTASISVSTSGTYSVTVTDQNGTASAIVAVSAGQGPVAGFTSDVYGLDGTFTDTSFLNPDTYSWDFGDPNSGGANTSSLPSPTHTFSDSGSYTVTFIVSNACGADTATAQVHATILPCIPNASAGIPGVTPSPDNIPCIERNMPYDFTMQTENFDSITISLLGQSIDVGVNWTRIDSIGNLPCGISWESDRNQYTNGQTGCIKVSGTSREIPGQYPVKIYITMELEGDVPILGHVVMAFDGELQDLLGQAGITTYDYKYVSRVIQPGGTCPARDTNSTSVASGDVCPPLSVEINGNSVICSGSPTTLTAEAQFDDGSVSYQWGPPGNEQTASISVSTTGTYSVTVADQSGTATKSITVTAGTTPTAGFTATASGAVATITANTSTGSPDNYSWNWGDNSAPGSGQIPPPHTYTSNGTFTITLTATNSCGSDQATQAVTTTGVFIKPIENNLEFNVYPNPSSGYFNLSLVNNSTKPVALRVFDLSGKLVYSEPINEANTVVKKQLDLSSLPKGVYTLHLSSEAGNGIQRLTIY